MRTAKLRNWVTTQRAKRLDHQPFSALPWRLKAGIVVITSSFAVSYGLPPLCAWLAYRFSHPLILLLGGAAYGLGWVISFVGLWLGGKAMLEFPPYFTAKLLYFLFPVALGAESESSQIDP